MFSWHWGIPDVKNEYFFPIRIFELFFWNRQDLCFEEKMVQFYSKLINFLGLTIQIFDCDCVLIVISISQITMVGQYFDF